MSNVLPVYIHLDSEGVTGVDGLTLHQVYRVLDWDSNIELDPEDALRYIEYLIDFESDEAVAVLCDRIRSVLSRVLS